MGKQIFSIKGMMRDLDPAKSPNQYAYEIRNLRLTAQEDTTMLALVTEKGNAQYTLIDKEGLPAAIEGTIIGYCLLHNYLVLFTHTDDKTPDYIYRLEMNDLTMIVDMIYAGNLGFGEKGIKIEAIGIYENEQIQKVYWIDGIHQPRFINIVADSATRARWYDDSFDFVPRLLMEETVEVKKSAYSGVFNAGTIQYVLTYYNKNGQQSAAFYQSPINYIAYENKGASPESTVSNSFSITIYNPDTTHYDYVRIYSIFRSSENGTPVCKKVADIKTTETSNYSEPYSRFASISASNKTAVNYYTQSGIGVAYRMVIINSSGREVDLEEFLQYRHNSTSYYMLSSAYSILIIPDASPGTGIKIQAAEGESLTIWRALTTVGINKLGSVQLRKWDTVTFTEVGQTRNIPYIRYVDNGISGVVVDYSEILFLGGANIIPKAMAQKNQTLFFGNYSTQSTSEEDKNTIKEHSHIYFGFGDDIDKGALGSHYMYSCQLDKSAKEITTFKGGETYHFGIILQEYNGTWTDVIPIGKAKNIYYPNDSSNTSFKPVKAYINFDDNAVTILNKYAAVKVVRLNTLPSVVYQGVLCPTVFNNKREDNLPYCQSSWFFREVKYQSKNSPIHRPQNIHNGNIFEGCYQNLEATSEIQGAYPGTLSYYHPAVDFVDNDFFVDWNTLTLNSPDIEFGQAPNLNYRMRIVGILPITAGRTSMSITYGTPDSNSAELLYQPIVNNNLSTNGYQIDLNVFAYKDGVPGTELARYYTYPIYPWHRNGSLTAQEAPTGNDNWAALLETKIMASLRESAKTVHTTPKEFNITKLSIYQDDNVPIRIEEDPNNFHFQGHKTYMGSIDTVLTHMGSNNRMYYSGYYRSTVSGSQIDVLTAQLKEPVRMSYGSTKHGVFSLKSDPKIIYILPNTSVRDTNFDQNPALDQKVPKATVRINASALQFSNGQITGLSDTSIYNVDDVVKIAGQSQFYYITNIASSTTVRVAHLNDAWLNRHPGGTEDNYIEQNISNDTIRYLRITYDFYITNVTNLGTDYYAVPVTHDVGEELDDTHSSLDWIHFDELTIGAFSLFGSTTEEATNYIRQHEYVIDSNGYSYMYVAELFTLDDMSPDYENGSWYVASEPYKTGSNCAIATIGDTYYQRYDCLKTYPHSPEDQNQIVEIFSFMCESKINIDGRYDGNRGLMDNTSVSNVNFNLLNKAYTQDDNFYTYSYLGEDFLNITDFPNQIIWTKTKVYGSDIDAWTHIPATSTLDMDGSLGEVRALRLWNDNLICFQDMGIAKIMYNERITMTTQQGVPVEIANSGKVDGSHYISNTVGCKNKDSIQVTQDGIYFVDSNKREFYKWSQGIESLSKAKGFNAYFYNDELNIDNTKTFYDSKLRDVYIRTERTFGNIIYTECLVYNEQLNEFTSFFDYDMDFMFNYKDSLVSIEHESGNLWKQFAGDEYLRYFGKMDGEDSNYEVYSIELIAAENPTEDKTFTNVEFRADVLDGKITQPKTLEKETQTAYSNLASINKLPFKTLRVWDEYQDTGHQDFDRLLRKGTNLSQKFRIWRADIGRDYTDRVHKFNRIRNPWARVQLLGYDGNIKAVIHDIAVMYV